jgi:hypothetical protein
MIDFKIKKWIKNNIAPHDATKAYKSMLSKYNRLSIADKYQFEGDMDKELNINQGIVAKSK